MINTSHGIPELVGECEGDTHEAFDEQRVKLLDSRQDMHHAQST
jgi:hypothetical protein